MKDNLSPDGIPEQHSARLEWWRQARFGLFIHYGPVSLSGKEISWSRGSSIPVEEYDNLYKQFNPVLYNANDWVSVAKEADIWINTGIADNQKQIFATDERLKVIKAYQKKALFNNNAIKNNAGGIDYFESGLVKPQIILKDLIKIFHPELMQDYQFVFYKKLE